MLMGEVPLYGRTSLGTCEISAGVNRRRVHLKPRPSKSGSKPLRAAGEVSGDDGIESMLTVLKVAWEGLGGTTMMPTMAAHCWSPVQHLCEALGQLGQDEPASG